MNNLTKRFAIFMVLGALLSSALLVGCGKSDDEAANSASSSNTATGGAADKKADKDEGG